MEKEPSFIPPIDANVNIEPKQKEIPSKPAEGELIVLPNGTTAFAKNREEAARIMKEFYENR